MAIRMSNNRSQRTPRLRSVRVSRQWRGVGEPERWALSIVRVSPTAQMRAIFAILGVALLSACANSTSKGQRTATPSGLGLVIADADRIVVANRWHGTNLQEFSHTFTGSEVRKVVDDVSFMSH